MSKKTDTKRYIFHNLDNPRLIQRFSYSEMANGTWEKTLVPGAICELTDWEYNFIVNGLAANTVPNDKNIDMPEANPQRSPAKIPRFQLQPVI